MTIAQFAARTGLSPSTLRFWESRGLLEPADRLDNNYRLYAADQIPTAQLVSSLREAGVPMADVRAFLDAGAPEREALVARWRQDALVRRLSAEIAARWLGGVRGEGPPVHLVRWPEPSLLAWLPVTAPPGPLPFAGEEEQARRRLRGARLVDGAWVRTTDLVAGRLHGALGFRVASPRNLPSDAHVEQVPPTVFASLECGVDDDKAAHRLFRFLRDLDLEPDRLHLERHLPGAPDRYQILVAVKPLA